MNTEYVIYGVIAVFLLLLTIYIMGFKNWLVYAVTEAETILGSGTGQLKLRFVYDAAVVRFPILAKMIPFSMFSRMVDGALEIMRNMIAENENIAAAVEGGEI